MLLGVVQATCPVDSDVGGFVIEHDGCIEGGSSGDLRKLEHAFEAGAVIFSDFEVAESAVEGRFWYVQIFGEALPAEKTRFDLFEVLDIFGRMEGRHFRVCGPVWDLYID